LVAIEASAAIGAGTVIAVTGIVATGAIEATEVGDAVERCAPPRAIRAVIVGP
jgi:hypothetical protein